MLPHCRCAAEPLFTVCRLHAAACFTRHYAICADGFDTLLRHLYLRYDAAYAGHAIR